MIRFSYSCIILTLMACSASQPSTPPRSDSDAIVINQNESKVPDYTLPDLLTLQDGSAVESADRWPQARAEIMAAFADEVYGHVPGELDSMVVEELESGTQALDGKALRKQWRIHLHRQGLSVPVHVLIYLPADAQGPSPLFLGMNFYGNQTIHADPAIVMPESWVRNNEEFGIVSNRATEASRGVRASRWPIERMMERGYGLAAVYYGDVVPDYSDCFDQGVFPLFYEAGQTQPKATEWGAIAAWAWSLSRVMDALVEDASIDSERIAVIGHSRLGKTALWAGAMDTRFSMVISNNSGCGGAALSRRAFGETVKRINTSFPHWFNDRFPNYNDRVPDLPIDQHGLIAAMAPRPVYVASASEDLWADPKGEFLSAVHASSVYALLGKTGLSQQSMPSPDNPLAKGHIGYHLRTGKHDLTSYDWEQYMNFGDRWMQ